jgi:hypothetical protein
LWLTKNLHSEFAKKVKNFKTCELIYYNVFTQQKTKGEFIMILKIEPNCILYKQYIRECYMNLQFEETIDVFCKTNECTQSDLDIKAVKNSGKYSIEVTGANRSINEVVRSFDFTSGLIVSDLKYVPIAEHGANPNRYLTSETQEALKKPLRYEYFWICNDLFLEVSDPDTNIKFKIMGITPLGRVKEVLVSNIHEQAIAAMEVL